MRTPESTSPAEKANWNRWAYGTFTLCGMLFALFSADRSLGFTFLGLALIMEPFDQRVMWNERPRWQRIWLYVHLGITVAALGWWIGDGDRG